jgi:hypothetical protein
VSVAHAGRQAGAAGGLSRRRMRATSSAGLNGLLR